MTLTRLILIRHAEIDANREFRSIGKRDDPLSEEGQEQAKQLAQALAGIPVEAIYSSPAQRALQTAAPLALSQHQEVRMEDDLRECDFGLWEGLNRADLLARATHEAHYFSAWERDLTMAPPDGESYTAMSERVRRRVGSLLQVHHGQTIVLVSHVGPVKALLCMALDAPLTAMFHLFIDPATINVVDWREANSIVRLVNSHAHLGWNQARWLTDTPHW
jgi:broad specificity phosphatase PhoE